VTSASAAGSDYAPLLIAAIEAFAEARSNPVLAVLGGAVSVEEGRKYPATPLGFGGDRLRAYYHCHPAANRFAGEHGHFHIFVADIGAAQQADRWVHLAGLSMDGMGQPLAWFAVNRWVTGGGWLPAARTVSLLDGVEPATEMALAEDWLWGMLGLYRDELAALLARRDRRLIEIKAQSPAADILDDRNIYALVDQPVDLFEKLRSAIASEGSGQAAMDDHGGA
jgi:hypothetical protein